MKRVIQNTARTGEALRDLREQKHLTMAEVADRANHHTSFVYRAEHNRNLLHDQLTSVAKALGFRIEIHFISEE